MRIRITKLYGSKVNIIRDMEKDKEINSITRCYIDASGRLHYMYADPNYTEYEII